MWMVIDIETYEKYEGTKKSEGSIKSQMITDEDRRRFDVIKRKNYYYPVLNSRKFVLGCVVTDEGEKLSFYNHRKMLNWIIEKIESNAKKGKRTFVYGHNIDYDMLGIVKDDLMKLLSSNLTLICDNPFLGSWKVNKKNWGFFCDTYSFFRGMSVAQIGNIVGYEKLKMPEGVKDVKEIESYCMRDCEVVLKAMQFVKEQMKVLGFVPRKFLTAGQVAMSSFMSSIRKENIHWNIMRSGEVYKGPNVEKCRPAYRGARNEAFKIGKVKDVTYIDINSLYPYAMVNLSFPKLDEELFVVDPLNKELSVEEILDDKFVGCLECDIKVPEIDLGYLPVRFGNKLFFPTGKRVLKGTWTTMEIKRALSLGYELIGINWVCLYPVNKENVFKNYINRLYDLRKESGKEMQLVVKMIMNNLYGKFAQLRKNKEYNVIYRGELDNWKKKGWGFKSVWGNKYIIERYNDTYTPKYTNLMIAIMITAFSRDYLYSFLQKIRKDDLVYCDTDGIVLKNWKLYKKCFKISNELGDWKIVVENEDGFIKGEKDYRVGEKIKVAGVSKRVIKEVNFDKVNEVKQKRRVGIKDALRNPGEYFKQLGTFNDYLIQFKMSGKSDIPLPNIIDERREWVSIID